MLVERLLWTSENFFMLNERSIHEIAFYYLMSLQDDADYAQLEKPFDIQDGGTTLCYRWHNVDILHELELVPSFLKRELLRLPDMPLHIVHEGGLSQQRAGRRSLDETAA